MKKIIALLSLFAIFLSSGIAQTTTNVEVLPQTTTINGTQYIPVSDINKYLIQTNQKIGWGKEVGEAINQGLSAVVNVAGEFSETDVGKFTMVLIAWRVMGKDLIRVLLGFIFLVIITILFLKVYKNTYVPKRVLTERTPQGAWKRDKKEYEVITPDDDWEGYQAVKIVMLFLYAGAVAVSYAIMFTG